MSKSVHYASELLTLGEHASEILRYLVYVGASVYVSELLCYACRNLVLYGI